MRDRSLKYNAQVLPFEMFTAPKAQQVPWLDRIKHASEPDMDAFTENFSLQMVPDYGDAR